MSAKILRVVLPLMLFPCLSALAFHFIVGHLTTSGGGEQIAAQCPPNDGPYNIKFTNISAVDRQLCILVTFFHASFDSKNLPLLAEFASSGAVLVVLPYIEAARQGRPFLLAFPTLLGAIYQNAGAGVMFPLYWLAFILSGQTRIRSGPQVKIDQAHAEATLFALLIGVVVPSGLMYFMVDAVVTAAWQAFPVWMLLAQQAHLLVRPSSRHPQSGYKTIQATFIFTFLLSAITHITVIWPLLGDTATLKYSFLPRVEAPDPTTTTLQYATLVFLQWDAAFSFGASLLGTMWFAESLQQSLIILVWNVVGSLAFGPGAALSGLLIWREARLNGGETVSNVKRD
ncbi:hypothetical protein EW146_g8193 [Bondarzewia mesenterica]|uniref:Uncharacterized protein n=1 Tax=Bondarzewia mesenterica TaxID=1095465 RepID=A0A4S4LLV3_9AGAM|nr:hypothetical protein EW146_g8193 [Bondarzewia mesenterica]